MFDERRIEGELDFIGSDIVYCGRQFDYSQNIRKVNSIIKQLRFRQERTSDCAELVRLRNLECRALMYLNTMNKYKADYEYQK